MLYARQPMTIGFFDNRVSQTNLTSTPLIAWSALKHIGRGRHRKAFNTIRKRNRTVSLSDFGVLISGPYLDLKFFAAFNSLRMPDISNSYRLGCYFSSVRMCPLG